MSSTIRMSEQSVEWGRNVLRIEARALELAAERLGSSFDEAVALISQSNGTVVFTGLGKSGHIGKKAAATLASTGTRAIFVHASEAGHGDLGMIGKGDILIALSNSGETEEVVFLASCVTRLDVKIIYIGGNAASRLAQASDIFLDASVPEEACPLGIAPTASTTVQLAISDALAVALMHSKGFTAKDFAMSHPSGTLGRQLFLRVRDVMTSFGTSVSVDAETSLHDSLAVMARSKIGAIIVNGEKKDPLYKGIFTDSDWRRLAAKTEPNNFVSLVRRPISEFISSEPVCIEESSLAVDALKTLEQHNISRLVCVDKSASIVGILTIHDLLTCGVA